MQNITKLTQKYISSHPSIKDCLNKGLINHSALARKISKELQIDSFDAILIACRRYKQNAKKSITNEKKIISILKNSKIEIKNKMIVAIIEKPKYYSKVFELEKDIKKEKGEFHLIEGNEVINIITNREFKNTISQKFKNSIVKINENLVSINILADEKIENTPGVISFIYSSFFENGINIVEEMSCWTDIMILIEKKDMPKAIDILSF